MNIFYLDKDPVKAAKHLYNKHVVKMVLETAQMLSTAARAQGHDVGYKSAYPKHPMTMWVGSTLENYLYACRIGIALTEEYTKRYGKIHVCAEHLKWLYTNHPSTFTQRKSDTAYYSEEGIPECMPEEYKTKSIIQAYQMYYMMDKMGFARYK